MSDAATEYFEVWLKHQIELARRKLRGEWLSINGKAAAEGWYRSGRRIKVSVRLIGEILRELAAEAYPRAAETTGSEELHTSATEQLFKLFDEFVAKVPALIESTGHASPRLEKAVAELIAPIRTELETSAKLAQLSTRSKPTRLSSESSAVAMLPHRDPIPKDHISLNEALGLFRRAKRGRDCDVHPPHGSPEWNKWYAEYSEALESDQSELAQPFLRGELEALVSGRDGKEYRITPSEWNSSAWPTRMFLSEEIHDLPGRPLTKHTGRTPYTHRATFEAWLKFWLRDWLLTELTYARLTPASAESRAAAAGCDPLETQPDASLYDPIDEPYWSFTMALAWIAWRTTDAVRKSWRKYCDERWFFVFKHWRIPGGENNEGWFLEQLRPSIVTLGLAEAHSKSTAGVAPIMSLQDAVKALWRELSSGRLKGTGIAEGNGERRLIEPHEWQDLRLVEEGDQDALVTSVVKYRLPTISSAELLQVWKITTGTLPSVKASRPSHRPRDRRDEVIRVLERLEPELLGAKLDSLLSEVNKQLKHPVSKDTLRRALDELK